MNNTTTPPPQQQQQPLPPPPPPAMAKHIPPITGNGGSNEKKRHRGSPIKLAPDGPELRVTDFDTVEKPWYLLSLDDVKNQFNYSAQELLQQKEAVKRAELAAKNAREEERKRMLKEREQAEAVEAAQVELKTAEEQMKLARQYVDAVLEEERAKHNEALKELQDQLTLQSENSVPESVLQQQAMEHNQTIKDLEDKSGAERERLIQEHLKEMQTTKEENEAHIKKLLTEHKRFVTAAVNYAKQEALEQYRADAKEVYDELQVLLINTSKHKKCDESVL